MNTNTAVPAVPTPASLARLGFLMACVATLAACGGGSGSDASSSPTPAPSPAAPAPSPASTAGDLSSTISSTTYTSGSHEAAAYAALNAARLAGGFGTLAQNSALDNEAQNMATYASVNYTTTSSVSGGTNFDAVKMAATDSNGNEFAHVQTSGYTDYTGYLPSNRATYYGYPSMDVSEAATTMQTVIDSSSTSTPDATAEGQLCVSGLLGSPGHRQVMMDPRYRDVGLGYVTLTPVTNTSLQDTFYYSDCYVATGAESTTYSSTGRATAATGWVGVFPADGATVSSTGDGHGYGYAPSVTIDSSLTLTTTSFTIKDSSGTVIPTTLNGSNTITGTGWNNWAFAVPNSTLTAGASYIVTYVGTASDGTSISKSWSFKTPAN